MPGWEQLGMQAAGQGMGAILGLALQNTADRRQLRQQSRLQQLQIQGDKELTDYNAAKQLQMWKATSYPAQMAMLKQAGLNPALIYGSSGPGGMTNLATGNVASGNAPTGGGEIQGMMGMGLMNAMQAAQIENIKANTQKTKAETENVAPTGEQIKMQTKSLAQGITNQQAAAELMELDAQFNSVRNKIANETMNDQIATVKYMMQQAHERIGIMQNEKKITDAEAKWKDQEIRYKLANMTIDTWLKGEQGKAAQQSVRESVERVSDMINDNMMEAEKGTEELNNNLERMNDNAFPEELKAILQALGFGTALKNTTPGPTPISGFHKR